MQEKNILLHALVLQHWLQVTAAARHRKKRKKSRFPGATLNITCSNFFKNYHHHITSYTYRIIPCKTSFYRSFADFLLPSFGCICTLLQAYEKEIYRLRELADTLINLPIINHLHCTFVTLLRQVTHSLCSVRLCLAFTDNSYIVRRRPWSMRPA